MRDDGVLREDLSVSFSGIEDPRVERSKKYPLCEILFLTIYAALCRVESWRGIEFVGNEKIDFLRKFFPFIQGIPSHQTIARVFSILKPKAFEDLFRCWSSLLHGSNEGRHIALDGKTLRGSGDKASAKKALHLLHACAVDSGLTLAQLEVGVKTNEITTVPEMIDVLDVKGAMISVDALNTQKEIAAKIIDAGANYTMALKGNHKTLNEHVEKIFEVADTAQKTEAHAFEETGKSHGRVVTRMYDVAPLNEDVNLAQKNEWKGLAAVGRVKNTVWSNNKESLETRYYLLSYTDGQTFAKTTRGHWMVESLHWTLDVTFSEDASQKRKDHAPRNYALVRKFALNILKTFKGKYSLPIARARAAISEQFMETILVGSGFNRLVN